MFPTTTVALPTREEHPHHGREQSYEETPPEEYHFWIRYLLRTCTCRRQTLQTVCLYLWVALRMLCTVRCGVRQSSSTVHVHGHMHFCLLGRAQVHVSAVCRGTPAPPPSRYLTFTWAVHYAYQEHIVFFCPSCCAGGASEQRHSTESVTTRRKTRRAAASNTGSNPAATQTAAAAAADAPGSR